MINKIEKRWCAQGAKLLRLAFDNQATSISDPIPLLGLALNDEPMRMLPSTTSDRLYPRVVYVHCEAARAYSVWCIYT